MAVEFFRPRRRDSSRGSFTPFSFDAHDCRVRRFVMGERACSFHCSRIFLFLKNWMSFLGFAFLSAFKTFIVGLKFFFVFFRQVQFFRIILNLFLGICLLSILIFVVFSFRLGDSGELMSFLDNLPSLSQKEKILGNEVFLGPGETLSGVLERVVKDPDGIRNALTEFSRFLDLRRLRAGQKFDIGIGYSGNNESGRLCSLILERGWVDRIAVVRDKSGSFRGHHIKNWLRQEVHGVSGVIQTSLYSDGLAAGIPANQIAQIFDVFSSSIDFPRDFRTGDIFHLFYEAQKDGWDRIVSTKKLIAVKLTTMGKERLAFRYDDDRGISRFYDDKGKGLRKALLLMPMYAGVLTSGYGMRRNPVHGYTELHPALDFGARTGTPVIAAGDGIVSYRGWDPRGYGKYLKIIHGNGYTTLYAHMSAFARGITKGKRVDQRQVIGYVGSTGMSTGPHLHYEIYVGDKRKNPGLVVNSMVSSYNLRPSELEKFSRHIRPYLLKLRDTGSMGKKVA